MKNYPLQFVFLLASLLVSCQSGEKHQIATEIFHGGSIYTADETSPMVEAVAIKDSIILFSGSFEEAKKFANESTVITDLKGKTMIPGLIESHGHLMGVGENQLNIDLLNATSYEELIALVDSAIATKEPGEWILGRGWHQDKWDSVTGGLIDGFPTNELLNTISPNNPVYLRHASGHAGIANAKALEIAGLSSLNPESIESEVEGGEVIRDELGNPTGVLNERAMGLVTKYIPAKNDEYYRQALKLAISHCHENGITSFHDAGIDAGTIELYQAAQKNKQLQLRIYAMVSGPDRELTSEWLARGPLIDTSEYLLTIRSIKLNCDGALGSRGAWLLEDYEDRPGHAGMATLPMEYVLEVSRKGLKSGFQVCSHAIGDRANREILDQYETAFKEHPDVKAPRFRMEHAQHIDPADLPRFADMNIIAAMQAVHMASDRPWAIDRLGEKRIVEGAYMWQSLLKLGVKVTNGTDAPVEPLNPFPSFYASVTRKTLNGTPEGGYEPAEKMTREQALKSYTIDGAYGSFEENIKGSITKGKRADLVILDTNIMTCPEMDILNTNVLRTIFNGNTVFEK